MSSDPLKIAVAIDFGTHGCAISYFARELNSAIVLDWGQKTRKTRTSYWRKMDVKEGEKPFDEKLFGDAGLTHMKKLRKMKQVNDEYSLFDQFKMQLKGKQYEKTFQEPKVLSALGKRSKVDASKLVTEVLQMLREKLEYEWKSNSQYTNVSILWVITVPAIWDDVAKQVMTRAANVALKPNPHGERHKVSLCLEPEAAAMYMLRNHGINIHKGDFLMFWDLGGGTADCVVQEILKVPAGHSKDLDDFEVREVIPPSGGPWGGVAARDSVLVHFKALFKQKHLNKGFCDSFFENATTTNVDNSIMWKDFLSAIDKLIAGCSNTGGIYMIDDPSVEKLIQHAASEAKISDEIATELAKLSPEISFPDTSTMLVESKWFHKSLDSVLDNIINAAKDIDDKAHKLLRESKTQYEGQAPTVKVVLVGGFGQNKLVYQRFESEFGRGGRLIRLMEGEAEIAVVAGAAFFGIFPQTIKERVIRKWYGLRTSVEWDEKLHAHRRSNADPKRLNPFKTKTNGKMVTYCRDVFLPLAEKGKPVKLHDFFLQTLVPLEMKQREINLTLFVSETEQAPKFTDDCVEISSFPVQLPIGKENEIEVRTRLGWNKMIVEYKIRSDGIAPVDWTSLPLNWLGKSTADEDDNDDEAPGGDPMVRIPVVQQNPPPYHQNPVVGIPVPLDNPSSVPQPVPHNFEPQPPSNPHPESKTDVQGILRVVFTAVDSFYQRLSNEPDKVWQDLPDILNILARLELNLESLQKLTGGVIPSNYPRLIVDIKTINQKLKDYTPAKKGGCTTIFRSEYNGKVAVKQSCMRVINLISIFRTEGKGNQM